MSDEQVDTNGKGAILAAILNVMQDVTYIQKDSFNPHGKYAYASEKAIKETLQPVLLKNGLIFQLETETEPKTHVVETTGPDGAIKSSSFLTLGCRYTLWHVSGQSITGSFIGSGNARDDKGSYAAITGAIKYIMTSLFLIPTGTDAEADGEAPQAAIGAHAVAGRTVTRDDLKPKAQNGKMVCPKCGKAEFIIKGKEEYGGGYLCYKAKGGCGFKGDQETFLLPPFNVPKDVQARLGAKRPVPVGGNEPPPLDDDDLPPGM